MRTGGSALVSAAGRAARESYRAGGAGGRGAADAAPGTGVAGGPVSDVVTLTLRTAPDGPLDVDGVAPDRLAALGAG